MPDNQDRFEEYVAEVCRQIRWKRARQDLGAELRTHLLDQRDACLSGGMSEDEAQAESLRQMGDPVSVGTQLDRVHRPKPQWDLLLLVWGLAFIGLVLQWTILSEHPYHSNVPAQALQALILGGIAMLAVYWLDYTLLGRWAVPLCLFGLGGGFVFILQSNGHHCMVLLLAPVCIALLIYGLRGKGWPGLLLCLGGTWAFATLAALAPFASMAVLTLSVGTLLILTSVWKGWMGTRPIPATAAALVLTVGPVARLAIRSPFLSERLSLALHPELEPLRRGYMGNMVRDLLRSARWVGPGSAGQAEQLMDNLHTDFLLTWVIHRLGWWAGLALIALLVLLLALALRRSLRQQGMLGSLLSLAAVLTLGAEAALYLLYDLGFLLLAPAALPFLSWGRWYMVCNLSLAGLLMSVFREERLPSAQQREVLPLRRLWGVHHQDGALVVTPPWGNRALSISLISASGFGDKSHKIPGRRG